MNATPRAGQATIRLAGRSDVEGIVRLHCSEVKEWYRDPVKRSGRATYAQLTSVQRFLHGGYWMDEALCRRHLRRYSERRNRVYVAEEATGGKRGRIVGETEVWFDYEPAPFGRYAELEMVITDPGSSSGELERQMLEHVSHDLSGLGHVNLDISPAHSGGNLQLLEKLGFRPIWDTRCFTGRPDRIERCDETVRLGRFSPDSRNRAGRTLQFCHYEPLGFAWGNRFNDQYLSKKMHARFFEPLFKKQVRLENLGRNFSLLVERLGFHDDEVRAFVWAQTDGEHLKRDTDFVRKVATATSEIVRDLGIEKFQFYAPWFCAEELERLGFRDGKVKDLWLRKDLARKSTDLTRGRSPGSARRAPRPGTT